MVLIDSKKYACETCIKGHRSSSCKHTNRPLYSIKRKGRPQSQCEHCRELRKTKQVHVKCVCQKEESNTGGEHPSECSKKGVNKMLESAAFPNGLPNALEASVAVPLLSQGAASDDDHESCSCLTGSECHCCTARQATTRARRKTTSASDPPRQTTTTHATVSASSRSSESPNPNSQIPSRISELRSLLPKPAHAPSSSITAHSISRHHLHETKLYSPYGRAYDHVHPNHPTHNTPPLTRPSSQADNTPHGAHASLQPIDPPIYSRAASSTSSLPLDDTRSSHTTYPDYDGWNSFQMTGAAGADNDVGSSLSFCGCGDGCACPSCYIHKPNADRAGLDASTCTQPDACRGCIDCATSLSYQSSQDLPPDTALSIYNNTYSLPGVNNAVDDWIRQTQDSISSFQQLPLSNWDTRGDALPEGSSNSPVPDAPAYPSGIIYDNETGEQTALVGRSRSFDDILTTFSNFDTSIPLDLSLFNNGEGGGDDGRTYHPGFDLETLQNIESMSADFDLDVVPAPPSRSASETPSSSEASGHGGNVQNFSDLGEMSMFYRHNGTGAGGARSSVKSLPDTLGYF